MTPENKDKVFNHFHDMAGTSEPREILMEIVEVVLEKPNYADLGKAVKLLLQSRINNAIEND